VKQEPKLRIILMNSVNELGLDQGYVNRFPGFFRFIWEWDPCNPWHDKRFL